MTPLRPDQWDTWIRPGSRVFVGSGAACPRALMASVVAHAPHLRDIELVHGLMAGACPWIGPDLADTFTVNQLFSDAGSEPGHVDCTPAFASEVAGLFLEGFLPLHVALIQVSPPDAHGYCSLGAGVDLASAACRAALTVIAQVNPRMPRTHGQSFIHRERIDAVLEAEEDLDEFAAPAPDPAAMVIGKYVAQLVPDGAILHLSLGAMMDVVLDALGGHKNLGIHTEVLTDAFLPLLRNGVVNNRRKKIHAGKTVTSSCLGTRALYDFVDDNPHVEFHPTEYVNNPLVIARNDRMVAVAGAEEIDLSGQVVAEPAGPGIRGGVGGHADFFRGATISRGGVPIIAMPAATPDGMRSRLVPRLRSGGAIATSRGHVHYVVTEYGVATLRGRTIRERALELIQVAHPRFRDDLLREAISSGIIPAYHRSTPAPVPDLGETEVRKLELKGQAYILRPLHPSDIRRLQEFFYSHTQETIQMRYGYVITRMPRERAYDLVNVDQARHLALGIFEVQGPRQIIHAVGRYYLDEDGRGAEVAFVVRESKRRQGLATTLFEAMASVARKRGLDSFWARVRRDNFPMLALFRHYGGSVAPADEPGSNELDVRIPLAPAAGAATAEPEQARPARAARPPRSTIARKGRGK